jgi:hypothetical protein
VVWVVYGFRFVWFLIGLRFSYLFTHAYTWTAALAECQLAQLPENARDRIFDNN